MASFPISKILKFKSPLIAIVNYSCMRVRFLTKSHYQINRMPSTQNLASGTQKTKFKAYFNYPLKDDSNLLKFKCKKQSRVILNAKKAFPVCGTNRSCAFWCFIS